MFSTKEHTFSILFTFILSVRVCKWDISFTMTLSHMKLFTQPEGFHFHQLSDGGHRRKTLTHFIVLESSSNQYLILPSIVSSPRCEGFLIKADLDIFPSLPNTSQLQYYVALLVLYTSSKEPVILSYWQGHHHYSFNFVFRALLICLFDLFLTITIYLFVF